MRAGILGSAHEEHALKPDAVRIHVVMSHRRDLHPQKNFRDKLKPMYQSSPLPAPRAIVARVVAK